MAFRDPASKRPQSVAHCPGACTPLGRSALFGMRSTLSFQRGRLFGRVHGSEKPNESHATEQSDLGLTVFDGSGMW